MVRSAEHFIAIPMRQDTVTFTMTVASAMKLIAQPRKVWSKKFQKNLWLL